MSVDVVQSKKRKGPVKKLGISHNSMHPRIFLLMYYQHPMLKTLVAGFSLILVVFVEVTFNRKDAKNRREKLQ